MMERVNRRSVARRQRVSGNKFENSAIRPAIAAEAALPRLPDASENLRLSLAPPDLDSESSWVDGPAVRTSGREPPQRWIGLRGGLALAVSGLLTAGILLGQDSQPPAPSTPPPAAAEQNNKPPSPAPVNQETPPPPSVPANAPAENQDNPPPAVAPTTQPTTRWSQTQPASREDRLERLRKLREQQQKMREEREKVDLDRKQAEALREANAKRTEPGQPPASTQPTTDAVKPPATQSAPAGEPIATPPNPSSQPVPTIPPQTRPRPAVVPTTPTNPPAPVPNAEEQNVPADEEGTPVPPPGKPTSEGLRPPPRRPSFQQRDQRPGEGRPGEVRPGDVRRPKDPAHPAGTAATLPTEETPDGRSEWFAFHGMPWEDVIRYFAKRLGKQWMNDDGANVSGELDYEIRQKFTKEEAIDRLNFLLQWKGFRFVEFEDEVYLVPLNEVRTWITPQRTYTSVEQFEQAHLRDMDYARLLMDAEPRTAQQVVDWFGDAIPLEGGWISVVGKTNKVSITAAAKDIRKFLTLLNKLDFQVEDPRQLRLFPVKASAREMEQLVREMMGTSARAGAPVRDAQGRTQMPAAGAEPELKIVADDRTKTLIVKGTKEQLDEIGDLIRKLEDSRVDVAKFFTTVIEIKNGNAAEIANLLTQIFQQEKGQQVPAWQRGRIPPRPGQPGQPGQPQPQPGQPVLSQDVLPPEDIYEQAKKTVSIVADDRTNAIVVYANDDGLKRVREMLEVIDKPLPSNFRTFKLEKAKAEEIAGTVNQLLQSMGGGTPRPGGFTRRGTTVVPDASSNSLYVMAEREEMQKVEEIIKQLDVKPEEGERHIVQLRNLLPSRVVQMLEPLLREGGGAGGARRFQAGGRPGAASAVATPTTQLIPLDEAQILIVVSPDDQWKKVEETIRLWDEKAVSNTPELRQFKIEKGNIDSIANTLTNLYRAYRHPVLGPSNPVISTNNGVLYVQAVKPALEEIEALVKVMDVAEEANQLVILPLAFADAAQVAQLVQPIVNEANQSGRASRQGGGQNSVQPEPATNSLVVRADKNTLERVKDFAQAMDNKIRAQEPERKFYTLKYAQSQDVVNAVSQLYGGSGGRGGRGPVGSQVKVFPSGAQALVVEAPKDKLAEIDNLVTQLDQPLPRDIALPIETRKLPGLDVQNIAAVLNQQFSQRGARADRQRVNISADLATESLIFSAPPDAVAEIDAFIKKYAEESDKLMNVQKFIAIKNADANYVSDQVKTLLNTQVAKKFGQNVAGRVSIVVDSRLNQLVINVPKLVLPMAEELIGQFDAPVPPGDLLHTITLKNADANAINQILQSVFRDKISKTRSLQINVDAYTNSIIVSGNKEDYEQIRNWIEKYDANEINARGEPKIYELKNANPWEVIQTLTTTFVPQGGGRRQQPGKEINFSVLGGTSVIVQAPPEKIEPIEKLIKVLDEAGTAKLEVRTYKLPGAGDQLGEFVRQLDSAINAKIQGSGGRERRATFMPYVAADALVVTALPTQFPEIEGMVEKFKELALDVGPMAARFFELENARANELVPTLQNMVNAYLSKTTRGSQARQINITADNRTNRVAVAAPEPLMQEVEKIIKSLDVLPTETEAPLRVIALNNADAGAVAQTLSPIYQGKAQRMQRQNASYIPAVITPEAVTNSLLIVAGDADYKEIEAEIKRIDVGTTEFAPVTIELKYADPNEVRTMIEQMFGAARRFSGGSRGGSEKQDVQVSVSNQNLVIKAPPKKLEQIKSLIAQVDAKDTNGLQIKTYELKVLNAQQVSFAVQAFLQQIGSNQKRGQMRPAAFGEPTTNTLLVIAPAEQLPFIDGMIAQMEAKQMPVSEPRAYVLQNARADQNVETVKQMLAAKVAEKEGPTRQQTVKTAVTADARTNRLFVFAPPEYQEMAGQLIKELDKEIKTGEVTRIIRLEQGDATQMAQTVNQTIQGGGTGLRGGGNASARKVTVTPDAGSNSILLAGLPNDVDEVEKLVKDLEITTTVLPEMQIFQLKDVMTKEAMDTLKAVFPPGRNPGDTVTITEDSYYNRLTVTANKRKMRLVEQFIKILDVPPNATDRLAGPRDVFIVDVTRGDAYDIASKVKALYPDEEHGGPLIEDDLDGEYITVKCRPSEFAQIEKLIRDYDNKSKVAMKIISRKPKGDAAQLLEYIKSRYSDVQIGAAQADAAKADSLIEVLRPEGDEPPAVKRKRDRVRPVIEQINPYRMPLPVLNELEGLVDDLRQEAEAGKTPDPRPPVNPPQKTVAPIAPPASPAQTGGYPPLNPGSKRLVQRIQESGAPATQAATRNAVPEREKPSIKRMQDGSWIIAGSKKQVEELEDALTMLEEDLAIGEVIRIFEFKYGDVTAAAQILDRMFNEQQGRMIQFPQQGQPGQPQMPGQQPGQQGGQQGGRRGQGGQGGQGGGPGGLMQMMQSMVGNAGGAGSGSSGSRGKSGGIRMATDPGHNYLFVKCDAAQLPEIRKLLHELDIPPGEVSVEVFQLKNLDAQETAENIKAVLGITKSQQQRDRSGRGGQIIGGGMPGMNPQQAALMQMMQSNMLVELPGMEGPAAKIDSVEIVPNKITNSLLVSAPPDVMKIIDEFIDRLENLESRNVVTIRSYVLEKAKVEDILPLLQEIFDATGSGGGGRGGQRSAASPASMGPVTIVGDPRNNTLTFTAEMKDVAAVEAQIKRLDIEGTPAEAEIYVCEWGDAEDIARQVEAIYVSGGGAGGRRPGRQAAGDNSGTTAIRITAENATNTILVWGPRNKRDEVFAKIEELDKLSKQDFREIPIVYADAEQLADKLSQMFNARSATGGAAGGRQRGGSNAAGGGSGGRVTVMGDSNAKKLLVRAPDSAFKQMQEMVKLLDKSKTDLQLKTFPLRHAQADVVYTAMRAAMQEYLTLASTMKPGFKFEPFTVLPDPRTNSLTVVGSPETFLFVSQVISAIDVETPEEEKQQFKVVMLKKADAATVAEAINSLSTEGGGGQTGRQPGGQPGRQGGGPQRGGGGAAASTAGAGELRIRAAADANTNSLMLFGKQEAIAFVEKTVIEPFEKLADQGQPFFVKLKYARAENVAATLNEFFRNQQSNNRGTQRATDRVSISADPDTNTLIVLATGANREFVNQLIEEMEGDRQSEFQPVIIPVTKALPSEVAGFIWQFLDEASGQTNQRGGRQQAARRGPQIIPNDDAKTLIVRASKAEVEQIRQLVEQFDNPSLVKGSIKIIPVPVGQDARSLASEIERIINQGEQIVAQNTGRPPRQVAVGSDNYTNSIIVSGDPATFGMVEMIMKQLADVKTPNMVTRVIEFKNLSAEDAKSMIDRLQGGSRSGSSSGSGGALNRGGGGTPGGGNIRPTGGNAPGNFRQPGNTPTQPRRPQGNQGGGNPGGGGRRPGGGNPGGGASLWKPSHSGGSGAFVATTSLTPTIALMAFARDTLESSFEEDFDDEALNEEKQNAADTQTAGTAVALRPRVVQPQDQPASQAAQSAPVTQPGEPLSVAGSLRGDVIANPIDSHRLVITGDAADLEFIEQILRVAELSAPQAKVEVFLLNNQKAAALAQTLQRTVDTLIAQKVRTPGPADRVSINAEARSNSLIVSASESNLEMIRELVERLDAGFPISETQPKMVPLDYIRAAEAVALLSPMVRQLNTIRDVPQNAQASVQAVERNNSLLIIGTPRDIEEIEKMAKAIDVEITDARDRTAFTSAEIVLIGLKNGNAEEVAKTLTDMIKAEQDALGRAASSAGNAGGTGNTTAGVPSVRKLRLTTADGRELPELDLERPIRVIAEKGTNSLIIFSSKKNNVALREIVGVFDTPPSGAETLVKAIALKYAPAEETAKAVKAVFDEGKNVVNYLYTKTLQDGKMPPIPPDLAARGLAYQLTVTSDLRSNTVFVVGRKDAVLLASGLIQEMDKPTTNLAFKPHVLPLKNMQATALGTKLTDMLKKRADALGSKANDARDNAVIMPDDRTNSLVVLASPDIFDTVQSLVEQLDRRESYSPVDVRFRQLQFADANKLQGLLQNLFEKKIKATSETTKEPIGSLSVLADARSNSLMLTGTRDYLDEAERFVDQLDQKGVPTLEVQVRAIKLNSATNIAALLQDMIDKTKSGAQGGGGATSGTANLSGTPIHLSADGIQNNLLIAASHEDMLMINRWVDMLDRPSEAGRITSIIPLRRGRAEDVSKTLTDMYKAPTGGQSKAVIDMTVTADPTTNSIFVVGAPALVREVEGLVHKWDQTNSISSSIVKIFKLRQADAQAAGDLLTSILEGRGGSVGGANGRSGGTTSGGSGSGTTRDAGKSILLVFQREHPEVGMKALQAMRDEVKVISDLRTNSLIITAPPESMNLMESLIEAIDVPPDAAKIRRIPLRNADAEEMVSTLQNLFAGSTTSGATGGNRGGNRGGSTAGGTGNQDQERRLTLEGAGGDSGGREELTFTADLRTNSVIAAGTSGYLELAEKLIVELDSVPIQDRAVKVYAPRNTLAESLAASIKEYSDAEKARLQEMQNEISTQKRQEREIVAIANKDANVVVLSYDPRIESSVDDIVRELDQPPPQVMIQVLIVQVQMDTSLELGVEFAFQDLQYTKAGPNDTTTFNYVTGTDVGAAGTGLGGFSFTMSGRDFDFLFRTLQTQSNLKVLSRPQIVAMDNQPAKFEVIQNVPYIAGTSTTTGGQVQTQVQSKDVGIKLNVTPQINPDGFVRMEISQEVSDITNSSVPVGPGLTAPIFFTRLAETVVTVKDGETVILGGLINSREEATESKVPIVGDIPGLGLLFRSQHNTEQRQELLVILTPRIVRTIEDYRDLSVRERDRSGLSQDILAHPLMEGLQLQPDEGMQDPSLEHEMEPAKPTEETPGKDEYGPIQSPSRLKTEPADPNSYDVPTGQATKTVRTSRAPLMERYPTLGSMSPPPAADRPAGTNRQPPVTLRLPEKNTAPPPRISQREPH